MTTWMVNTNQQRLDGLSPEARAVALELDAVGKIPGRDLHVAIAYRAKWVDGAYILLDELVQAGVLKVKGGQTAETLTALVAR